MVIQNNTIKAEGNKVLYIAKLDLITKEYSYGSVMLPVNGKLTEITTTINDVIECFLITIDSVEYKVVGNSYGELVTNLIRLKYTLDQELALYANSILGNDLDKMQDFLNWRVYCKKLAKLYINE